MQPNPDQNDNSPYQPQVAQAHSSIPDRAAPVPERQAFALPPRDMPFAPPVYQDAPQTAAYATQQTIQPEPASYPSTNLEASQPQFTDTSSQVQPLPAANNQLAQPPLQNQPTGQFSSDYPPQTTTSTTDQWPNQPVAPAPVPATPVYRQPANLHPSFGQLEAPAPVATSRKRHLFWLIGSILAILAILAIGFYLFSKLILDRTNVSVGDLVDAKTGKTTYLRPKQWTKSQNGEAYGVSLDAISKNVAMISMTESPDASSYDLSKADETSISQIRSFTIESMTDTVIKNSFRNDSFCSEVSDIKKTAGTRHTSDILDIVTIEANCTSKYGDLKVKMLIWLGSDKLLRNSVLVASNDIWPKNQQSFQKMLESGTVQK